LAHIYHYYCYGGDQDAAASPHVFCFANVGDSVVSKSADAFAAVLANYAFEHLHLKKSDYGKVNISHFLCADVILMFYYVIAPRHCC